MENINIRVTEAEEKMKKKLKHLSYNKIIYLQNF